MLNKLTIIIPSRNRSNDLIRQINYLRDWGAQIFILDGSDIANPHVHKLSLSKKSIFYIHETTGLSNRLMKLKGKIKTRYSMLMADDEFFVKSSVIKCIRFLENHPKYSACSGLALAFKKSREGRAIFKEVYPRLHFYNISDNQPKNRVINHLSNYVCSSIYGIVRSKIFVQFLDQSSYATSSSPETREIWFESIVAYAGKIMVLPILYWLRSNNNQPVEAKNHDRSLKFYIWYNDKKYRMQRQKYIKSFCKVTGEKSINFFELALYNYSLDLKSKGHGSIKHSQLYYKIKKILKPFILKIRINQIINIFEEKSYFQSKDLHSYLKKKKFHLILKF